MKNPRKYPMWDILFLRQSRRQSFHLFLGLPSSALEMFIWKLSVSGNQNFNIYKVILYK